MVKGQALQGIAVYNITVYTQNLSDKFTLSLCISKTGQCTTYYFKDNNNQKNNVTVILSQPTILSMACIGG